MLRTKVTISLREVPHDLLHQLHPVLNLQVYHRLMKVFPNDLSYKLPVFLLKIQASMIFWGKITYFLIYPFWLVFEFDNNQQITGTTQTTVETIWMHF